MRQGLIIAALLTLLAGCSVIEQPRIQVTPLAPTPAADPGGSPAAEPDPAASPPGDGEWRELEPGLEWRELRAGLSNAQALRIDPAQMNIRVAYDAASPGRVSEWMEALGPLAVVNGGYFDEQGRATALTVYDGVAEGSSYDGFGGMLAVDAAGALSIRSLRDQPYDPAENLAQALQSTPMLVQQGAAVPLPSDNGERSRRTVAALDGDGRLLLIAIGWPSFSLSELGQWLADGDLGVVTALNLDGGSSTGMQMQNEVKTVNVDSLVRVPQVVLVERR
ncbi:MAG TPA: phosphodiester glycosidase family protein [Herpetosiphonaceae bacterium]